MARRLKSYICVLIAAAMTVGLSACTPASLKDLFTFEKRPTEKPVPSDENVAKTFFVDPKGQPKTFLCGWSPEEVQGKWGERWITQLSHESMHCNIEFQITENYLIGNIINPSYADKKKKWVAAVKIPIVKHYYYEKRRDEYGRDTNVFIENDSRSHWSARPMMRLDLSGVTVESWSFAAAVYDDAITPKINFVDDIEWDKKGGFLGFSAHVSSQYHGSAVSASFRFNFLQFQHDRTFTKIPYSQLNARFFNALHVMGALVDGDTAVQNQDLWVAHWDLRKTTKIYINDVPEKLQPVIVGAVEAWNKTFRDIGASPKGVKAFEPILTKNRKHVFDLRYPTIHWIADKRASRNSPLGIGQAHADVANGKILYGLVVLWGGALDDYIRSYTPVASGSPISFGQFPVGIPSIRVPKALPPPTGVMELATPGTSYSANPRRSASELLETAGNALRDVRLRLRGADLDAKTREDLSREAALLESQIVSLNQRPEIIPEMVSAAEAHARSMVADTTTTFANGSLLELLKIGRDLLDSEKAGDETAAPDVKAQDLALARKHQREFSTKVNPEFGNMFVDADRSIGDLADALAAAPPQNLRGHDEIVASVVADLTLHEFGHMLGLGHQFKSNIVPEEGTVPSKYVTDLKKLATKEAGYLNYTTVMDYRNGRVEAISPLGHMKPGPHDELVLRYLYKGEYSTYDAASDRFRFFKVAGDGVIPNITQGKYPTSYFPACNDLEASMAIDPYCNRWDKGSSAQDIVESYFESVRDNLTSSLYAFSDTRGGAPEQAESWLYYKSFTAFGRVRLFYDEMRRYMLQQPHMTALWHRLRRHEPSLHEFSKACRAENLSEVESPILKEMMKDAKLVDLCRANLNALEEFKTFISLPDADFPLIDFKNRFVQGGFMGGEAERKYDNIFGTWYRMANLPFKSTALFTVTTANPYLVVGSQFMVNPFYNTHQDHGTYMTLFPREYTQILSDTVKYNLRFAGETDEGATTIGRSVLNLVWMLGHQRQGTNDIPLFPPNYMKMLAIQTQFEFNYVFVIVTNVDPEGADAAFPRNIKRFTANAFEPRANKSFPVRDVYILKNGNVLARLNNAFLLPVSNLRFYSDKESYFIALKTDFDIPVGDRLNEDSVKQALSTIHDQAVSQCLEGRNGAGLANFFEVGQPQFKGFYIPPGIADDSPKKEKMREFLNSVDEEFDKYERFAQKLDRRRSMISTCDEALRGVSEIISTSGLLSGYWLQQVGNHMVNR